MKKIIFLLLIILFSQTDLHASDGGLGSLISPGPLAKAHEKYDGIKTCVKCHKLGGGVPDENCLGCHDKLASRIKEKKTIHARYTVSCIKCHRDHQGRNFRMVSLDEKKFDHKETGYDLQGGHGKLKCGKCHKKDRYSGLSRECLHCHDDYHKKQLSADCFKCHNFEVWKDLKKFNHDRDSKYTLTGRHKEVKCDQCHKKKKYRLKKYTFCDSCHKNPHKKGRKKTGKLCRDCHVTKSWKTVKVDHEKTQYPLTGKHRKTPCAGCHKNSKLTGIPFKSCNSSVCHKDSHKKQFGKQKCETCHNTRGWRPSIFDHASQAYKGYKLDGKHRKVACIKCHSAGRYRGLNYGSCATADCHRDPHKDQFKEKSCHDCHSTSGWKKNRFDHNSPSYKGYKLEGMHKKTACEKCHKKGRYKGLKYNSCSTSDCHKDPHKRQFRNKKCDSCHKVTGWKPSLFKHNAPSYEGFKLSGKHLKTACEKCHVKGKYRNVSSRCRHCHAKDDVHKKKRWKNCERCHDALSWRKSSFDHNRQSNFPLIGKHKILECKKCHKNRTYKAKGKVCSACHKDVHRGEFKESCDSCHTQYDWQPRNFPHGEKTVFRLRGVHSGLDCLDCHKTKGTFSGLNRNCSECHHDPHRNQFGRVDCSRCHGELSWMMTTFNHSETGYPLVGKHRLTECEECHEHGRFRGVGASCASCHERDYLSAPNHLTRGYSFDCVLCHRANFTSWDFRHQAISGGCAKCHLNSSNPPKPANHTANNWVTCEQCHRSTSAWIFTHPAAGTSGCASCHLNMSNPPKPADHTANNWVTCEQCHRSTSAWIFTHPAAGISGCANCHLNMSNPPKPADHTTNGWITCEQCHRSTSTWTFTHPLTSFPLNHKSASPGDCAACHPGGAYNNSGGCIECHNAEGEEVHKTNVNAGCLSCHPTGN